MWNRRIYLIDNSGAFRDAESTIYLAEPVVMLS